VVAEHSWGIVAAQQFDFGAMVVSFSKSVEAYFRWAEPKWQDNHGKPLTLGGIARCLEASQVWRPLYPYVSRLNRLRCEAAHAGKVSDVPEAQQSRSLAFDIITDAERIRIRQH
jgi:hypothetical protein